MQSTSKVILALSLLLCSLSTIHAQQLYRRYTTQKVNQNLLTEVANYSEQQAQLQQLLRNYQHRGTFQMTTIPIIFHIVHYNEVERLSEAQIQSQLDALNRDFSQTLRSIEHPAEKGEGYNNLQAQDTYIRFCLAGVPNNINYVQSTVNEWTNNHAIKSSTTGGTDAITPENYLNIWVAKFDSLSSGYAQFPLSPSAIDGIAIDYRFFGTVGTAQYPYDEGKTLTHLVGNYLGLQDLWNENEPCSDDGIWDTPVHNAPNHGCPRYRHFSLCNDKPVEMSMNLMDNTNDACSYLFTWGQVLRMQAVLSIEGLRDQLGKNVASVCDDANLAENTTLENRNENISTPPQFSIHPNPAKDQVQIQFEGTNQAQLFIYRADGTLVQQCILPAQHNEQLDCSNWQAGFYFLQLFSGDYYVQQELVIIAR